MSKRTKPDDLVVPALPDQRYRCISIDPPWHFESRAPTESGRVRNPQKHYPTMSLDALEAMPIRDVLDPAGAFVFMWITGPMLIEGAHIRLAKAWGLRRSSMVFVWLKTLRSFDTSRLRRSPLLEADLHIGTGFTTQANCEYVVLLRRGSPKRQRAGIRQVIIAPVAEHSRKPDEFFRRAELYCEGPRLDMFAGRERPGWDSWGIPHRPGERAE